MTRCFANHSLVKVVMIMLFYKYKPEKKYIKLSDLIRENDLDARRVYEWVRLLEAEGEMRFEKTPLGRRKITKEQSELIIECQMLEEVFGNWKEVFYVIRNSDLYQKIINEEEGEEEYKNFRGLKNVVWRKY